MKSHTPDLVSVIVPVYNAETWLDDCIQSIVHQQYSKLQIILVNDGSKDNSENICLKWTRLDSRVQYIYQANSGVSVARNKGLAEAEGEYICFVDSDDWLEKNHITELLSALKSNIADMATIGYTKVNTRDHTNTPYLPPATQVIQIKTSEGEDSLIDLFESRLLYCPCAHLFKANIISKHNVAFRDGIHFGEDRLFLLDYLSHCNIITTVTTSTYNYRIENPSSLSHIKPDEVLQSEKLFFERNYHFIQNLGYSKIKTQQWLYTPIFNAYIDNLFLNRNIAFFHAHKKIKQLNSDSLFRQSLEKADTSTYSRLILFLFKWRLNILLALFLIRKGDRV